MKIQDTYPWFSFIFSPMTNGHRNGQLQHKRNNDKYNTHAHCAHAKECIRLGCMIFIRSQKRTEMKWKKKPASVGGNATISLYIDRNMRGTNAHHQRWTVFASETKSELADCNQRCSLWILLLTEIYLFFCLFRNFYRIYWRSNILCHPNFSLSYGIVSLKSAIYCVFLSLINRYISIAVHFK